MNENIHISNTAVTDVQFCKKENVTFSKNDVPSSKVSCKHKVELNIQLIKGLLEGLLRAAIGC